jgi:TM2 domain-containing membrane protein YozV
VKLSKSEMKKMKKSSNAPMSKSDKELLILILLWLFLGGFAAHRWYAGKPLGWNILFILTAGGCGVWAIVDLINIIKGDF